MYTNNRDTYRQTFFQAWQKYKNNLVLEPLEQLIVEVILLHPEYQELLENPKQYQNQSFTLEENPFMHLSLHISLKEQINLDRPKGITEIYQKLLKQFPDKHDVDHAMLNCLAEVMWESQQHGVPPDEQVYLEKLKKLTV